MRPTRPKRCMATVVVLIAVTVTFARAETASEPNRLNAEAVTLLLDVVDAVADVHPGFTELEAGLAQLPEADREAAFDEARRGNESSPEVQAAIGALLGSPGYAIYFRRFQNVTGEQLRDLLLDLPYRKRRAPGDIGITLYELIRQRESARAGLDRLVGEADVGWVYEIAQRFAPAWEGELPTLNLFYDSNAGSFAAEGVPFFNVYTGIDLERLGLSTDAASLREAEETMAHELQHVLAEPTLYPEVDARPSWQEEWIDQLTRGMVGEGVANLCSPPAGGIKDVYEDPEILAALVERYNGLLRALLSDEISEEEVQTWYRDNYFDVAIGLLRDHLAKRYSGAELEERVQASMRYRPDVEHALGWWMISRVWEADPRPEVVVALLGDPFQAYRRYNETLGEQDEDLRIAPDIVEALAPE